VPPLDHATIPPQPVLVIFIKLSIFHKKIHHLAVDETKKRQPLRLPSLII